MREAVFIKITVKYHIKVLAVIQLEFIVLLGFQCAQTILIGQMNVSVQ